MDSSIAMYKQGLPPADEAAARPRTRKLSSSTRRKHSFLIVERFWKEPLSLPNRVSWKEPHSLPNPQKEICHPCGHMSIKLHSASEPSHHDLFSCLDLWESKLILLNFLYASSFLIMTLFPVSLKLSQIFFHSSGIHLSSIGPAPTTGEAKKERTI